MANYACPDCGGRLDGGGPANVFRCRRCGEFVAEAISRGHQRVREFYERATSRQWEGIRG